MRIMPSICFSCKWLQPAKELPNTINGFDGPNKCQAFPKEIPAEIIMGRFDHRNQFSNEATLFELDGAENSKDLFDSWEIFYQGFSSDVPAT